MNTVEIQNKIYTSANKIQHRDIPEAASWPGQTYHRNAVLEKHSETSQYISEHLCREKKSHVHVWQLIFIVNLTGDNLWASLWGCFHGGWTEETSPTLNLGSRTPWSGVLNWLKRDTVGSELSSSIHLSLCSWQLSQCEPHMPALGLPWQ